MIVNSVEGVAVAEEQPKFLNNPDIYHQYSQEK